MKTFRKLQLGLFVSASVSVILIVLGLYGQITVSQASSVYNKVGKNTVEEPIGRSNNSKKQEDGPSNNGSGIATEEQRTRAGGNSQVLQANCQPDLQDSLNPPTTSESTLLKEIQKHERYLASSIMTGSGIFLALLSLAATLGWTTLTKKIASEIHSQVDNTVRTNFMATQAHMYTNLTSIHFSMYEKDDIPASKTTHFRAAKAFAEFGLSTSNAINLKLISPDDQERYINLIAKVKNNYAYVMSKMPSDLGSPNQEKILALAKEAYDTSKPKTAPTWHHWQDTYASVLLEYGNDVQKLQSKRIVERLLNSSEIEDLDWKIKLFERYKQKFSDLDIQDSTVLGS